MCRWIGGMLAALLVAVPLIAQDKGADEKGNDRVKQFKEVQQDYQKAAPDAVKAYRAAKTDKEKQAVFEKLNKEFAPRIIKLVEADPKGKMSFDMLTWAIQALPDVDPKVYDLLGEHWAKDAKIKPVCQFLIVNPLDSGRKLLRKVLEDNSDKDTKGLACFALAKLYANKGDKEAAETEKMYERMEKEFADVKIGGATLGDLAKGALFEVRHLKIGMAAPNAQSEDVDGKKVQLKDYKGKVVVLDIWATWCGPCKAMIPHEREMVKKLKEKPFALISISADEQKDTLKKFLEDTPMPWTHWWSGQNAGMVKEWNIQAFPTLYVLDSKGVIRYKFIGARDKELEEAVDKLLAEVKQ
jgi:thiol-disulfide isomerase/thioredoxin